MADHSLDALLRWMAAANSNALQGWDAIAALERDKLNTLLGQIYAAGFASDSCLPPMSGEYPLSGGSAKEVCHQVTLGAPRLSFENTGLNDARARLTFALVGGLSLTMHKNGSLWQVATINLMSPLQGPHLHLELLLDQVPGTVGERGRVALDLRNSDNFQLDNGDTPENQERGGEFFRQLFRNLPDEQRVFVLGVIEPGEQSAMRPHSFRLLTQHRETSGDAGAVLILISMRANRNGQRLPANYPWLIPTGGGLSSSASVLIDRQQVLEGSVMLMLTDLIGGQHFTYEYEANGRLRSATASAGEVVIAPTEITVPVTPVSGGEPLAVIVRIGEWKIPAVSSRPLKVTFEADKASIVWTASASCISSAVLGQATLPMWLFCKLELDAGYQLAGPDPQLLRTRWNLDIGMTWPEAADTGSDADTSGSDLELLLLIMAWTAICTLTAGIITEKGLRPAIGKCLTEALDADTVVENFTQQSIKLNFAHAIEADNVRLPRDLLSIGQVSPRFSRFDLTPGLPMLLCGSSLQFSAQPAQTGLQWRVEALSGGDEAAGSIDRNGRYTAPPAIELDRQSVEVRIIATNGAGHQGVALARVLSSDIDVAPLIQVCQAGRNVELQAQALGSGTLNWSMRSLRDTPPGTLRGQGGTGTYNAPSGSSLGNCYGLDEINIGKTGQPGVQAWVLVNYGSPVTVRLAGDPPPAGGAVQLQAMAGTTQLEVAEWLLPLGGPGTIDEQGRYTPDPQSDAQFVLVLCKAMVSVLVFEGALILPLPLADFGAGQAQGVHEQAPGAS